MHGEGVSNVDRYGSVIHVEDETGLKWLTIGAIGEHSVPFTFGPVAGTQTDIIAPYPRMFVLAFNELGNYASYIESD